MLTREKFDAALTHKHYSELLTSQFQPGAYESPIEERLAWSLSKVLERSDVALVPQQLVPTVHGAYRVDMLLHSPKRNTVIECDGKDYHQDYYADCARSAALLESGYVDQVVRYPGDVLHHSPDDAVYSLSLLVPDAFEGRAATVSRNRASFLADRTRLYHELNVNDFLYPVDYDVEGPMDNQDFWDEDDNYHPATFTRTYITRTATAEVHRVESQNERDVVVVMRRLQSEHGFSSRTTLVNAYLDYFDAQQKTSRWA